MNTKQYVSFDGKDYTLKYDFFIDKEISEAFMEYMEVDDFDVGSFDEEFKNISESQDGISISTDVNRDYSEKETHYSMKLVIDKDAEEVDGLVPVLEKDKVLIPIFIKDIMPTDMEDAGPFLKLMLKDSTWTMIVDKSITKTVSSVKIADQYDSGEALAFREEKDSFIIEIPAVLILYENNEYTHVVLYKYTYQEGKALEKIYAR